jgi:hypothetical protein
VDVRKRGHLIVDDIIPHHWGGSALDQYACAAVENRAIEDQRGYGTIDDNAIVGVIDLDIMDDDSGTYVFDLDAVSGVRCVIDRPIE